MNKYFFWKKDNEEKKKRIQIYILGNEKARTCIRNNEREWMIKECNVAESRKLLKMNWRKILLCEKINKMDEILEYIHEIYKSKDKVANIRSEREKLAQ